MAGILIKAGAPQPLMGTRACPSGNRMCLLARFISTQVTCLLLNLFDTVLFPTFRYIRFHGVLFTKNLAFMMNEWNVWIFMCTSYPSMNTYSRSM